jgi:hypothetical protein
MASSLDSLCRYVPDRAGRTSGLGCGEMGTMFWAVSGGALFAAAAFAIYVVRRLFRGFCWELDRSLVTLADEVQMCRQEFRAIIVAKGI